MLLCSCGRAVLLGGRLDRRPAFAGRITLWSHSTLAPYRGPMRIWFSEAPPSSEMKLPGRPWPRATTSPAWRAGPPTRPRTALPGCGLTARRAPPLMRPPLRPPTPTRPGTPSSTFRGTRARRGRRSRRWPAPPGTGPSSPAAPSTRPFRFRGGGEPPAFWRRSRPARSSAPGNYGEAKAAIEHWTTELAGDKAHICPARLIGCPGDRSDRYGYWPARFARDTDPVLVPDIPTDATQIIDVRDLAAWILTAAGNGTTGALNALSGAGAVRCLPRGAPRRLAGASAEVVAAPEDWLVSRGANYWAGPDSLPLWLPPDHEGFATRSSAAARAAGLRTRPWPPDTLADQRPPRTRPRTPGRDQPGDRTPDPGRLLPRCPSVRGLPGPRAPRSVRAARGS